MSIVGVDLDGRGVGELVGGVAAGHLHVRVREEQEREGRGGLGLRVLEEGDAELAHLHLGLPAWLRVWSF